ncbi:MAG: protease modulator HflK, partial [Limisphaerales bacterium]
TGLFGFLSFDIYAARVMGAFLAFMALETLIILVMEIYRPRVRGRELQLLYESRVVGLLGQPGGIIKTVAHTLDYQFGFKVSDTWFYRYVERAFVWLILLWASVFLISSSFVVLAPHEEALIERFGKPINVAEKKDVLGPGLHLKLPWPIDRVYRYSSKAVNQFHIGFIPDPKEENNPVLLWTRKHYLEEFNMLVASRDTVDAMGSDGENDRIVPVNLLTASIPIQYQITDVRKWARNHEDAATLLERLAWREVSLYLVSVDIMDIMAAGRTKAAKDLQELIQAEANRLEMGCTITFVGLQDIHPPIQVAGAYEQVVGAMQDMEKKILDAQAYQLRTVPAANAQAIETVENAKATKISRVTSAAAESGQFNNQVKAFSAAPEVYKRRLYLKTVAESLRGARKYIIGTTNTQEIIYLKLDDAIGSEFTDVTFNEDKEKQQQSQQ